MTTKHDYNAAIKTLVHHQNWRTGADIEPLEPRQITKAIDVAVHALRCMDKLMQEPSDEAVIETSPPEIDDMKKVFKAMRDQALREIAEGE